MELTFPFKNFAFNELRAFFEKEKVRSYQEFVEKREDKEEAFFFKHYIKYYRERLPSFENEILQIINTSNQETIDFYFNELNDNYSWLQDYLDKDYLPQKVKEWNESIQEKFEEKVNQKSEEYFKKEERTKYKHLVKYEDSSYLPGFGFGLFGQTTPKTITKTNYNFFCIEDKLDLISTNIISQYQLLVEGLAKEFVVIAAKYAKKWSEGEIKSNREDSAKLKPIVFFEGQLDLEFFLKATELYDKEELLSRIEIRQRGSSSNLDKLWNILITDNWETVPQTKILIYDCDTGRPDQNSGHIFRRTIPQISKHSIKRGIENLFSDTTIDRAIQHKKDFVDYKKTFSIVRGVELEEEARAINKDEKRNFCDWVCENGNKEDFKYFESVFKIIEDIIGSEET